MGASYFLVFIMLLSLYIGDLNFKYMKFSTCTFLLSSRKFRLASLCVSRLLYLGLRFNQSFKFSWGGSFFPLINQQINAENV